jgi:hypothetical protein
MPKARHPKVERFIREGLFKDLKDFSEFERRVDAERQEALGLPTTTEGDL